MCQVPFHNERKQIASTLHTMVTSQACEKLLKGGVSKHLQGKLSHEILCTPPAPGELPKPCVNKRKIWLDSSWDFAVPTTARRKKTLSDFKILPRD